MTMTRTCFKSDGRRCAQIWYDPGIFRTSASHVHIGGTNGRYARAYFKRAEECNHQAV